VVTRCKLRRQTVNVISTNVLLLIPSKVHLTMLAGSHKERGKSEALKLALSYYLGRLLLWWLGNQVFGQACVNPDVKLYCK